MYNLWRDLVRLTFGIFVVSINAIVSGLGHTNGYMPFVESVALSGGIVIVSTLIMYLFFICCRKCAPIVSNGPTFSAVNIAIHVYGLGLFYISIVYSALLTHVSCFCIVGGFLALHLRDLFETSSETFWLKGLKFCSCLTSYVCVFLIFLLHKNDLIPIPLDPMYVALGMLLPVMAPAMLLFVERGESTRDMICYVAYFGCPFACMLSVTMLFSLNTCLFANADATNFLWKQLISNYYVYILPWTTILVIWYTLHAVCQGEAIDVVISFSVTIAAKFLYTARDDVGQDVLKITCFVLLLVALSTRLLFSLCMYRKLSEHSHVPTDYVDEVS